MADQEHRITVTRRGDKAEAEAEIEAPAETNQPKTNDEVKTHDDVTEK